MAGEPTYIGHTGATRDYKEKPTIENYVSLRRSNPDEVIMVAVSSGFEWMLANQKLIENFGFEMLTVVSVLDADSDSISTVCLHLLELIIEREKLRASGRTHAVGRGEAISDSMINHFIGLMLDGLDSNNFLYLPRDLIVLIRHQLGTVDSEIEKKQNVRDKKALAIFIGESLIDSGQNPSYRNVAKILKVSPTTVMRWFPDKSLKEEIEIRAPRKAWFDKHRDR